MNPVGAEDVRRIAVLARIGLEQGEAELLALDFASILGYLERLHGVDTAGVAPLEHVHLPEHDVLRQDTPRPSLGLDAALRSAPAPTDDGSFGVPRILGGDGFPGGDG